MPGKFRKITPKVEQISTNGSQTKLCMEKLQQIMNMLLLSKLPNHEQMLFSRRQAAILAKSTFSKYLNTCERGSTSTDVKIASNSNEQSTQNRFQKNMQKIRQHCRAITPNMIPESTKLRTSRYRTSLTKTT